MLLTALSIIKYHNQDMFKMFRMSKKWGKNASETFANVNRLDVMGSTF